MGAELGGKEGGVNLGPLQIWILAIPIDGVIMTAQKLALIGHHGFFIAQRTPGCHAKIRSTKYEARKNSNF